MYYTIYKTTNTIDGKIYIGKHRTKDLDDGYMGSGKYLKRAIEKYGIENFTKEILFCFDNETDMNTKEAELVHKKFVKEDTNYNLCVGGQGGFSYINENNILNYESRKRAAINKWKNKKYREKMVPYFSGILKQPDVRERARETIKEKYPNGTFGGKSHTEETKLKISVTSKGMKTGEKNSQFGTMWITNGFEAKKIKRIDSIPEGWYKGAKLISTPELLSNLEECKDCMDSKETHIWHKKLIESNLSLRKFVHEYNYPHSYQTLSMKCKKYITNFDTQAGKSYNTS